MLYLIKNNSGMGFAEVNQFLQFLAPISIGERYDQDRRFTACDIMKTYMTACPVGLRGFEATTTESPWF